MHFYALLLLKRIIVFLCFKKISISGKADEKVIKEYERLQEEISLKLNMIMRTDQCILLRSFCDNFILLNFNVFFKSHFFLYIRPCFFLFFSFHYSFIIIKHFPLTSKISILLWYSHVMKILLNKFKK